MIHNIWKRLTGQERLYRMEHSLQKKMLKCENEEQWEKLNQRRKKIRQQRHRIQTRCRMMAMAGIILLAAGTVKLGMAAFTGNTESQKKKPDDGMESVIFWVQMNFLPGILGFRHIMTCTVQSIS